MILQHKRIRTKLRGEVETFFSSDFHDVIGSIRQWVLLGIRFKGMRLKVQNTFQTFLMFDREDLIGFSCGRDKKLSVSLHHHNTRKFVTNIIYGS